MQEVWDLLPHPEGSVVRYMARRRLGSAEHTVGDVANTVTELVQAAEAWQSDGYNIYVQVNPTCERARSRPRAQDITHWSWFLVDIDPNPGDPDPDPARCLEAYLSRLRLHLGSIHPTVIDSGRGMQAWLRLGDLPLDGAQWSLYEVNPLGYVTREWTPDDGVLVTPERLDLPGRVVARRVMGFWLRRLWEEVGPVAGCVLDTSCSDLPRVMRCPNTVNTKTGRVARVLDPGRLDLTLAGRLISQVPLSEFKQQVSATTGPVEGRVWQDVLTVISKTGADFLRYGAEEPGRHKAAVATVYTLRDNGLTPEACLDALLHGNEKCRPEPIDPQDIARMVEDAYRVQPSEEAC